MFSTHLTSFDCKPFSTSTIHWQCDFGHHWQCDFGQLDKFQHFGRCWQSGGYQRHLHLKAIFRSAHRGVGLGPAVDEEFFGIRIGRSSDSDDSRFLEKMRMVMHTGVADLQIRVVDKKRLNRGVSIAFVVSAGKIEDIQLNRFV